jgi:EmrB/QacA subfamily drug resistance transporter
MFSTVIAPALPAIKDELNLSLSMQTWTVTSYSLAFGTALVAGGRLGDLIGEVRLIVIGFLLFGVGLLVAGLSPDGLTLVGGRTVQGIGIGISAPATLSIVVNSFPPFQRGVAVGVWGFAHGLGLLLGPLFVGHLLEHLNWRWVFWAALPMSALVICVTLFATRNYRSTLCSGRYDSVGLLLGGLGITLVTYGLQNADTSWRLAGTWGPLASGVVLLVLFVVFETRIADPLVDFSLFRNRLFFSAFFAESAVGFVYIPMLTFVGSMFFLDVLGYSPVKAGWVIVITTGTCMALEPPAGRIVDRVGPRVPMVISLAIQGVALFWMSTFNPQTTLPEMILPLALMGGGVGIALPACNTAGMSALKPEQSGMGAGLMQMTFNVPAALGVALVTSITGMLSLERMRRALAGQPFLQQGLDYAQAVTGGKDATAAAILQSLPPDSAAMLKSTMVAGQSSLIAMSMGALGFVVLAGALLAGLVLPRQRENAAMASPP